MTPETLAPDNATVLRCAAVAAAAAAQGADTAALLDSREFMDAIALFDPGDPDFSNQVGGLVRKAAAHPRYQKAAPPAPAAPEPPAPVQWAPVGPGEDRPWTQADYDYWVAHERGGEVLSAAMTAGRLGALGFGAPRQSSSRRR